MSMSGVSGAQVLDYGMYVQAGGYCFADSNGEVWMYPQGSIHPVKIGSVGSHNAGAQVALPSQMPVQWIASPGATVPADPPPPAADPVSWIRALDMMQMVKKSRLAVRCEPDLVEVWND